VRGRLYLSGALAIVFMHVCGGVTTRDRPAPREAAPPLDGACDPLPAALASYDAITDGAAFTLALVRDDRGVWVPAERLPMPLHHASAIEWQGADLLDAHAGARVTVIATGLGRTSIDHDADRNTWFATYAARIERVCP
jgi:hypothetical protein